MAPGQKKHKNQRKNQGNVTKSTKSVNKLTILGGQSTPLLKRSQWGMKPCGGRNKTVAQWEHSAAMPGGIQASGSFSPTCSAYEAVTYRQILENTVNIHFEILYEATVTAVQIIVAVMC